MIIYYLCRKWYNMNDYNRILKEYVEGESHGEEYDTLIPWRIEVLECRSYADCSYKETVRFTFVFGNENGATPVPMTKKIVELDIETGYISDDRIRENLITLLSGLKILHLGRVVEAFIYRKYYTPILSPFFD